MTLNVKKVSDSMNVGDISIKMCPSCNSYISHIYFMQDSDSKIQSKWYSCACGIVVQEKEPTAVYDKKYWDKYDQYDKKLESAYEYPIRIYLPIIEELLYGRRALVIGRTTEHQPDALKSRGWVTTTIDRNSNFRDTRDLIVYDFETFDFDINQKFNLIWIYHTLECFKDPVKALDKCKSLLTEDGILFLASPDTDFIHTRGSAGFIHWKPEYNHIMWNRRSITKQLEKLDFNVIMCRQNYEQRFPAWDDYHLIAQLRFF